MNISKPVILIAVVVWVLSMVLVGMYIGKDIVASKQIEAQKERYESEAGLRTYNLALKMEMARRSRQNNVAEWALLLSEYPESDERKAFAQKIMAVTEDGDISDEDYQVLMREKIKLDEIQKVAVIKNEATNIIN